MDAWRGGDPGGHLVLPRAQLGCPRWITGIHRAYTSQTFLTPESCFRAAQMADLDYVPVPS